LTGDTLAGVRVMVSRPEGQNAGLVGALTRAGAEPVAVPTLAIEAVTPSADPLSGPPDWLMFVSRNAVTHGLDAISEAPTARVATAGSGTASALRMAGASVAAVAVGGQGAMGLFDDPAFAPLAGARVEIVRGVSGREAFADALRERGTEVAYREVYRRCPLIVDTASWRSGWQSARTTVPIGSSEAGLEALLASFDTDGRARLYREPLVVVSERLADVAEARGFSRRPTVAAGAGDEDLVEAVRRVCRNGEEAIR